MRTVRGVELYVGGDPARWPLEGRRCFTAAQRPRTRLDAAVATLRKAVAEHQTWLDKTLVPNAKGDFRIGAELYDQKLKFALMSELSRSEIGDRAKAELTRARGEMYGIAQTVLKGKKGAPALPANPTDAQRQKAIEAALERRETRRAVDVPVDAERDRTGSRATGLLDRLPRQPYAEAG